MSGGPDRDRIERGGEVYEAVYAGLLPSIEPGAIAFVDLMYAQLFAEQWSRPQLGFRERRLLTLAVLAANGDADTWGLHLEAALRNGELSEDEAREAVIHLAQYVGYPRAAPMAASTEAAIGRFRKATAPDGPAGPPAG